MGAQQKLRSLVLITVVFVSACAHTGEQTNNDPLEPFNRAMFKFNDVLDRAIVKPVAKGYTAVVPPYGRKRVGNFFRNLREPTTIVNGALQGKLPQAGNDIGRLLINSTVGLLGLFDVASKLGYERHEEDFGQTFAVWKLGRGPYLVLPFIGPSTLGDGIGLIPQFLYTDPRIVVDNATATLILLGVDVVDQRARLLSVSKVVDLQLDPYAFTKEAYLRRREFLIHDGDPPQQTFEDEEFEDDEDWESIWDEEESQE